MTWIKRNLTTIILVLMGLVGAGLIAYPSFADWWNSFHQSRAVATYAEVVANLSTDEYDRVIASAELYNKRFLETGLVWQVTDEDIAAYNEELAMDASGIMSYIVIPKINVTLPIYHGVSESVLQVAIGHLEGTSLPVGGESTHCVVSGHRGLPSAKLFTDIDKLVVGDTFTINTLNRTMTYEVDQIRIVEPTDLSALQLEAGKDYCTLVTCTPYGINTHRLLVRGHRVANPQGEAEVVADAIQIDPDYVVPVIAIPIVVVMFLWVMLFSKPKKDDALAYRPVTRRERVALGKSLRKKARKRNSR